MMRCTLIEPIRETQRPATQRHSWPPLQHLECLQHPPRNHPQHTPPSDISESSDDDVQMSPEEDIDYFVHNLLGELSLSVLMTNKKTGISKPAIDICLEIPGNNDQNRHTIKEAITNVIWYIMFRQRILSSGLALLHVPRHWPPHRPLPFLERPQMDWDSPHGRTRQQHGGKLDHSEPTPMWRWTRIQTVWRCPEGQWSERRPRSRGRTRGRGF